MKLLRKKDVDTLTSEARVKGLHTALLAIHKNNIQGDIIECGVFRGGNIIIAKTFFDSVDDVRRYYCFDTFTGMTAPTEVDGTKANTKWGFAKAAWCRAFLDEVKDEFEKHNCLDDSVSFIEGDVAVTLLDEQHLSEKIALLRLDTDWYESTLIELKILYPRLVSGGYLIIDDYGAWEGARKAVDEYFGKKFVEERFIRLDDTGIMFKRV